MSKEKYNSYYLPNWFDFEDYYEEENEPYLVKYSDLFYSLSLRLSSLEVTIAIISEDKLNISRELNRALSHQDDEKIASVSKVINQLDQDLETLAEKITNLQQEINDAMNFILSTNRAIMKESEELSELNRERDSIKNDIDSYYDHHGYNGDCSHHDPDVGFYHYQIQRHLGLINSWEISSENDYDNNDTPRGRAVRYDELEEELRDIDYQIKHLKYKSKEKLKDKSQTNLENEKIENIKTLINLSRDLNAEYDNIPISAIYDLQDLLTSLGIAEADDEMVVLEHPQPKESLESDNSWYSEDDIANLLGRLLARGIEENSVHILAQTQLENNWSLRSNLEQAVGNIIDTNHVALIPLHLHGNHWVGMMIRQQEDRNLQVIIINPTGQSIEEEGNATLLLQTLTGIMRELNIWQELIIRDLMLRQQYNGDDCGPFMVDNLVRLALSASYLDNLDEGEIVRAADLQWRGSEGAHDIRELHRQVLADQSQAVVIDSTNEQNMDERDNVDFEEANQNEMIFTQSTGNVNSSSYTPTFAPTITPVRDNIVEIGIHVSDEVLSPYL